jgi:hypothetical protein
MRYRLRTLLILMLIPPVCVAYDRCYRLRAPVTSFALGHRVYRTCGTTAETIIFWPAAKIDSIRTGSIVILELPASDGSGSADDPFADPPSHSPSPSGDPFAPP